MKSVPPPPLNRESLIKTILKIDLERRTKAYDYVNKRPWQNRTLDCAEHIVSQIPFPKNFASRCTGSRENRFDFNQEFSNLKCKMKLRDYYDVSPIIAYMNGEKHPGIRSEREFRYNDEVITEPLDLSKSRLDKVSKTLKNIRNQDKLLSSMAYKYLERYMAEEEQSFKKVKFAGDVSVRDYFDTPMSLTIKGSGLDMNILPNDLLRPAFSLLRSKEYILAAAKVIDPGLKTKEFDFYRLQEALRIVQAHDREKRFEFLKEGGAVLLTDHFPGTANPENFRSHTSGRSLGHAGALFNPHPLWEKFPHSGFLDWQFFPMMRNSRSLLYDRSMPEFLPVIELIPSFKMVKQNSMLSEFVVGKGRLMISGLNFDTPDPGAKYMLRAIVEYLEQGIYVSAPSWEPENLRLSAANTGKTGHSGQKIDAGGRPIG